MDLDLERKLARDRLAIFQSVYQTNDAAHYPIAMAIKWAEALDKEPLDLVSMKKVVDASLPHRDGFGFHFFLFCNHVEAIAREEIRATFESPPMRG